MRKIGATTLVLLFILPFITNAQDFTTLKLPVSNKIVVKFIFRNGSIADPEGKEGLTALTANLMVETGTAKYTKTEIDEIIFPMAANYSANTDKEVSVFTFEFPAKYSDDFYEIMMGVITTPEFTAENFERVKSNQLNYVEQVIKASSDEDFSKMALEETLFKGTPYEHMVAGNAESVRSITLDDVAEHYRKYFTTDNLHIGIAGDFSDDYIVKIKDAIRAAPSHTIDLPQVSTAKRPDGIQVMIIQKDNALGSAIFAGYPIDITREDDDFAALMVANSWLGEHRKSYGKLYKEIRDTRSMNYGDYTYIEWYEDGSYNQLPPPGVPRSSNYFALWIRPVQTAESLRGQYPELKDITIGHAHFALRLALREIDNLAKNGMTEEQFEATRDFLTSYIKLYTQTPERELGFLMDSKFYNRRDYIQEIGKKLEQLTVEDVNAAIRKYLQVEDMYVAIVTDDSEAKPLAESLKNNKPSPMSYSNIVKEGLPENVLKEDAAIEKYPLNVKSVDIVDSRDLFR